MVIMKYFTGISQMAKMKRMKRLVYHTVFVSFVLLTWNAYICAQNPIGNVKSDTDSVLLPSFPVVPPKLPIDSVTMGDWRTYPEMKLNIPIASGPFEPTWESIEKNYPGEPAWLREAKFGIWVHFGPQSAGESGDWYARNMYMPGTRAYNNHLKKYGHPSEVGYKEVLRDWNPTKLDPAKLTKIYQDAGARFLMIQGVHHDNYDMWNSKYQPWNSVNIGPKRDLIGEWAKACRANGMHYGVTFHHEYTWWWWQTAFGSDNEGAKKGIPYDGNLTLADGKGKWWEGYDPRLLYGINLREYKGVTEKAASGWSPAPAGIFSNHLEYTKWYATQWALRMMDVIQHYDPDFIYTDGTVQGPFTGNGTGTGIKANAMQTVMADYYNRTLKNRGEVNTFSIVKFRKKTNGTVNTEEHGLPADIKTDQPWIGETPVGDWFYAPDFRYDSGMMIRYIIEAIAHDGNAAISIAILPDGSLDEGSMNMLKEVGVWMRCNGEAVYGSHAWKIPGEGELVDGKLKQLPGGALNRKQAEFKFDAQDIRFTVGKNGALYAFCMNVPTPGMQLKIKSLGTDAKYFNQSIKDVKLIGYNGELLWKRDAGGLTITYPANMPFATSVVFKVE
jgi:alpha-L-fucosidase